MSDLIDRQAAIRWVKQECNPYGKPTLDFKSGKRVMEHLEMMPSAQPKQQWIPCSERLPFDAGYYLTTTIYNEVFCDYWNSNEWNRTEQVIAWMPMPEPYSEDQRWDSGCWMRYRLFDRVLEEQPTVEQPERMRGRWVYAEDEYGIDGYHCNQCGFFVPWDYAHNFINYIEDYHFCPNCGADMREGSE